MLISNSELRVIGSQFILICASGLPVIQWINKNVSVINYTATFNLLCKYFSLIDLPEERRLHTVGCWSSTALGKSGGHVRHRPIHLERQRKSTNIFSTRGIIIPGTSRFFILALRHILNSLRSIKFFTQSFSVLLVFLNVHIDYWGPPLDTVQLDTICFSLAGLIPLARCPHTTLFSLIAGSFCFKFFREIRLTVVAFLYLLSFVLLCIFRHRGYTDDVKVTCNQISRLNLLLLVNPGWIWYRTINYVCCR